MDLEAITPERSNVDSNTRSALHAEALIDMLCCAAWVGLGTEQASRPLLVCGRYRRDSWRITLAPDQRFVMWSAYVRAWRMAAANCRSWRVRGPSHVLIVAP